MRSTIQNVPAPSTTAATRVHANGWKIVVFFVLAAFAAFDLAALAWAASLAESGVVVAVSAGFILIMVLVVVTVWIMEELNCDSHKHSRL